MPRTPPELIAHIGRRFLIVDWVRHDRPNLPARAHSAFLRMVDGKASGRILPLCRTLGEVADLHASQVLTIHNCSWGTVQAIAESLARAGLTVDWERHPKRSR